ncbi:MAG: metallophosphoesterase family protein [Chloroflexota bacterium]
MRIALISDTHGNFTALAATLTDIRSQQADQIIFLGDAATIGSEPAETLDALRELDCPCIMGNHDDAVLDPARAMEFQIAPNLHTSLHWSIERLRADHFDFLETFLPTLEIPLSGNLSMLCFHGSPRSNTDMLLSTTPADTLDNYFSGQASSVWVGGHTHIQMARRHGDKLIVNPGSVGNAFKNAFSPGKAPELLPWAEYAILETADKTLSVDLRRVPFDTNEVLRRMSASGNPAAPWWLDQYK